jgi:hypothetical protein
MWLPPPHHITLPRISNTTPKIRDAIIEVKSYTKAPIPLVAASAIGAISLACQTYIDVKRDNKLFGPTGLFLVTIADSQPYVPKPYVPNHMSQIDDFVICAII